MKTLLTTLFAAAATSVAVAQSTLPTEYAHYDLDGDGTLTVADAQVIYRYILGIADEAITLDTVDLNGDEEVNTADVVRLYVEVNKYMNLGDVNVNDWTDGGTVDGGEAEEDESGKMKEQRGERLNHF